MAFVTAIFITVAGSIFKYTEVDFKSNSVKTMAEIKGITEYGYPVLSYTVDGKEYNIQSRYLVTNPRIGSKVEIEYHKKNPAFMQIGENPLYEDSNWMIVLGILGTAVTAYLLHKRRSGHY